MKSLIKMRVAATFVLVTLISLNIFSFVRAEDPVSASLTYDPVENSFSIVTSPQKNADVSIYYKDGEGTIDAVFGKSGENLPAETCSSGGTCVPDTVTYGIIKAFIEDEHWLYVAKFRVVNGFTVLDEDFYEEVQPSNVNPDEYVGSPPENILLQMKAEEAEWLQNPFDPVLSSTPAPTSTPPVTSVVESAIVLAASSSATISLTPSPTPANPVAPVSCSNGVGYVTSYIAAGTSQGTQQDGLPVPAYRTSPTYGFNAPDDLFYSTGVGGVVTYSFPGQVIDIHDADGEADIRIYETTIGRQFYPDETARVEVSQDGSTWIELTQRARGKASVTGVTSLDIHETGLPFIQHIRLTDITNYPLTILDADGYDVNAIEAIGQECAPTPTITTTPTQTPTITLIPSPTPADPIPPLACIEGTGYMSDFVTASQGTQQDGLPVPAYRSLPSYAFGAPDAIYYSLGIGGTATYKFAGEIQNIAGADFSVYEESLGRSTYPVESVQMEVSADGSVWFPLSTVATSRFNIVGVTPVDFNETGLSAIQYIRFTDQSTYPPTIPEADGFDLNAVVATTQICTNEGEPGLLTIRKTNSVGVVSPGSEVTYTMQIQALDRPVDNVTVRDLPPAGFSYVKGSWTARSSDPSRGTAGNLKSAGITTEPTYASPGSWNLGSMKAGEVVTLTYRAKISTATDPGTYTDLAWTQGENGVVLGTGVSSSYVNEEFVGSEVTVDRNTQAVASINIQRTETRESSGEVLGASTRLPATGASNLWILTAVLLLSAGGLSTIGGFVLLGRTRQKGRIIYIRHNQNYRRFIYPILLTFALISLLAQTANAASITSIRISVPEDRVNTSNFKISFVTLDSESRALIVRCYKKGPADGGFLLFGAPIALQPGGNSGFCNVDSNVVGQSGANYQFIVSVQAAGDSEIFSDVVGTSFNNQVPGTPVNYSKEQFGCSYRIKFRTANDGGKTKKVEIYRSEFTSFTADNNTKVGEVSAASNEDKQFENAATCGKRYYFVIRAFDEFGNGSAVTGDSEVQITTVSTGTTTTASTGTDTGTAAAGAIPVAAGAQTNVNTPPEETNAEVEGEADQNNQDEEEVLGVNELTEEERKQENQQKKIIIGITIAAIVGIIAYVLLKKKVRRIR